MQYIICLLAALLVACSSGSNGGGPRTAGTTASFVFSQANITMTLGSTTQVTGTIVNASRIFDPFPLYMSESGIITLTPDECATFDYDQGVHSCQISIAAIGIGTTIITGQISGPPLTVTVTN